MYKYKCISMSPWFFSVCVLEVKGASFSRGGLRAWKSEVGGNCDEDIFIMCAVEVFHRKDDSLVSKGQNGCSSCSSGKRWSGQRRLDLCSAPVTPLCEFWELHKPLLLLPFAMIDAVFCYQNAR